MAVKGLIAAGKDNYLFLAFAGAPNRNYDCAVKAGEITIVGPWVERTNGDGLALLEVGYNDGTGQPTPIDFFVDGQQFTGTVTQADPPPIGEDAVVDQTVPVTPRPGKK